MQPSLPRSSFIAFAVTRSARPILVWNNPNGIAGASLREHAFHAALDGDAAGTVTAETATFLAERYGGLGIGANGGGARCGLAGAVQIKGIGRNALAGSRSPYWHAYGGETVAGGVRDAVWGEICHAVLPFGAVRVHGLIDTGTVVPVYPAKAGTPVGARRGLTVRQPALRPAHFIRSLGFPRTDEQRAGLAPDAERTRSAVQGIVPAFLSIYGPAPRGSAAVDCLNDCMASMFARFAHQEAAARAKRIVHGTISPSNLCLDGRWIDFGTCSSVSDYGRIIVAKSGCDAGMTAPILSVAVELTTSLRRYLPPPLAAGVAAADTVYRNFLALYAQRLDLELLKLTGMTEARLLQLPAPLRAALADLLHALIRSGNDEPFKLFHQCGRGACMPDRMGHFHLNTILSRLALGAAAQDCDHALQDLIAAQPLRASLVRAYLALRDAYLALFDPARRGDALAALRLHTVRLNAPLPGLYRHVLDAHIDAVVESRGDVDGFIAKLFGHATAMLADSTVSSAGLHVTESEGSFVNGVALPYPAVMAALQTRIESHVQQFSKAPRCETAF